MKTFFNLIIFIILFYFLSTKIYSQELQLLIKTNDSSKVELIKSINYLNKHQSKKSLFNEVDNVSKNISLLGYINNTYILNNKDSTYSATFTLYKKIDSIRIHFPINKLNAKLLKHLSPIFKNSYFEIKTQEIESKLNQIITFYEKAGASFTNCSLSNLKNVNNKLHATLNLDISSNRKINNIIIKGYKEFPLKHLIKYLNLKKNSSFNINTLQSIDQILSNTTFITQLKKPEVLFTDDSTTIYLYLKKKPINQIDGLIGFGTQKGDSRLRFNGYLNLKLNNTFNKGETFELNWKKNGENTQNLKFKLNAPFIFNTKFDLSNEFSILKQDSTYTNTGLLLNLKYHFNQKNSISAIFNQESSNLTSISNFEKIKKFKNNFYGLSYNFTTANIWTDFDRFKFSFSGSILTGNRKNDDTKTKQEKIELFSSIDFIINPKISIHLRNSSKFLNSKSYLENELFRIGGINSIRGFNDESIYTSKYNISNLEINLKTSQSTHLYTITDFAIFKNDLTQSTNHNYSFGIGYFNFTEKNSLNLSYAFGNELNKPFLLKNSKLHVTIKRFF